MSAPTPSRLGMAERKALFEKQSAGAAVPSGAAPVHRTTAGEPPTKPGAGDSNAGAPVLSLKERMAMLSGGGGGDGKTAQCPVSSAWTGAEHSRSPEKDASPGQTKPGGLQDRLKVFGAGAATQGSAQPAKQAAPKVFPQQTVKQQERPTSGIPGIQMDERISDDKVGARPHSLSIMERMAALQGGDANKAGSKEDTVVGKLRHSAGPSPTKEATEPSISAASGPAAVPERSLSLKERMARLQQQEKTEVRVQEQTFHNNQNNSPQRQDNSGQVHVASKDSSPPKLATKVQARWEGSNLSTQAREVAAALGGLQVEDEEEDEVPVGNVPLKSVVGRVSMFETGDMAAGWDVERDRAAAGGREQERREKAIDQSSLDVNDIKNRWKTGAVKPEETTKKDATDDALFRCYTAASSRTGGVAEIQRRMQDLAEGKKPSPPAKQQTKVQEIAEQIHFDPNTMLPGAQHPNLNYNATEASKRATEWRQFAQQSDVAMDDDDDLPPPSSYVTGSGDPASIAASMKQLKERAAQPIEERLAAASLDAPGVTRQSTSIMKRMSASSLLQRKGLM